MTACMQLHACLMFSADKPQVFSLSHAQLFPKFFSEGSLKITQLFVRFA